MVEVRGLGGGLGPLLRLETPALVIRAPPDIQNSPFWGRTTKQCGVGPMIRWLDPRVPPAAFIMFAVGLLYYRYVTYSGLPVSISVLLGKSYNSLLHIGIDTVYGNYVLHLHYNRHVICCMWYTCTGMFYYKTKKTKVVAAAWHAKPSWSAVPVSINRIEQFTVSTVNWLVVAVAVIVVTVY